MADQPTGTTSFPPTPEQQDAIDAFYRGDDLSLEAGAGTGKTSTLRLLGDKAPRTSDGRQRTGIYLAYNAAIAAEAKATFPSNVLCRTGHGHTISAKHRNRPLGGQRQPSTKVAEILGIRGPHRISETVVLAHQQIASIVTETVTTFARSADTEVLPKHVPARNGIDTPDDRLTLAQIVLPYARRAWADIENPHGVLRYEHDHYRKQFHLHGGRFNGDFLFVDEAQDSAGVTVAIARAHQLEGMRIVAVGDRSQAINGWQGAVDAMDAFGGTRLALTKSFRFGPAVAEEANKWLHLLDATIRITGHEPAGSIVAPIDGLPDAILCRTNAEAVSQVMRLQAAGTRCAMAARVRDSVIQLARAADQLRSTGQTWHPELCAFDSWSAVQDYVEHDAGGRDLKVFVDMVDEYGTDTITQVMNAVETSSDRAQVTITTAHSSKGLEWDRVKIAGDFKPPKDNDDGSFGTPSREDMMLAYVAVTRAKTHLDPGGLAWVDRYFGAHPIHAAAARRERARTWAADAAREAASTVEDDLRYQRATGH